MNIHVQVTGTAGVRDMLKRLGTAPVKQAMAETAVQIEDYIRAQAGKHYRTGALNSSIFKKREGDGWLIGHDLDRAPHAVFFQTGTGLWGPKKAKYAIKPKYKKTLRWAAGDRFAFAKGVMHPGIKQDAWIARAAALAPKVFEARVIAHINKAKNNA